MATHVKNYTKLPTFEDLKLSIRDRSLREKIFAIEAVDVDVDAWLLLEYLKNESFLILCFFLILCIGIYHGALDHLKGKKLLKIFKIKNTFIFYQVYIIISLLVIIFCFQLFH